MKPPFLAHLILTRSVSRGDRPYLLAELEMGVRAARRWYWREALGSLRPGLLVARRREPRARKLFNGSFRRSIVQSVRTLRRQPLFVVGVVGALTLGVSSATAVFTFAEAVFLRPLPYSTPRELVALSSYDVGSGLDDRDISGPDYFDIESLNRVFADMAAYEVAPVALENRDGYGVKIEVARVTPRLFSMLGVRAAVGRVLIDGEVGSAAPRHAILSHALATEYFGMPATAVGSSVSLDGESFLVVGVVRKTPPLDAMNVDAWVPLPYDRTSLRRQATVLRVVARGNAATSPQLIQADLDRIALALESAFPESNLGRRYVTQRLDDVLASEFEPAFAALILAVSLLLIIAVVNASGLLLVRFVQRESELAIREAIGASRSDILGQLLMEGLLLGVVASIFSLSASLLLIGAAENLVGSSQLVPVHLNPLTLLVVVVIAPVASVAATLVATLSTKTGSLLRSRAAAVHATRTRSLLLAGQLAATTVLLVCVSLLGRSLQRLVDVDPGFEPNRLVTAAIDLPDVSYPTDMRIYPRWPKIHGFYDRVANELEMIPSVTAAAVAWHHPMKRGWLTRFLPEGAVEIPIGERERVNLRAVSSGYLGVIGARIRKGRDIARADGVESERVVLVNRVLQEKFFADVNAVGKRVQFFGEWWRIVGVVDNFKSHGLGVDTRPAVFPSIKQMPSETIHVVVRGNNSVQELLDGVRRAVWRIDPQLAPYNLVSLEDVLSDATAARRLLVWVFGWMGGLALLLSAVGLIGTVTETIEARRHEIGLRAALGAGPKTIVRFVFRDSVSVVVVAVGVGLLGAFAVTRFLSAWLYEVSSTSPTSYWSAGAMMIGITLLASAGPAAKLLRYDPKELLRSANK